MKQFEYTINDPLGIHARPAGMLAKAAKNFADTTVTVSKNGNAVDIGKYECTYCSDDDSKQNT